MQESIPTGTLVGGRWRIIGVLGEGGFGQVLLAFDESEVGLGEGAVKVLHPNTTPQERDAFLGEAQKIAALRHQNLVGYLDSGHLRLATGVDGAIDGEIRPYVVTERCQRSLADHLQVSDGGVLTRGETLTVLADITAGLVHLHERGMIHRDLKPGNVLFADGGWKLADFGLMRDLSATGSYHRGELLIGTPLYMAPELFTTSVASASSDIYALGVLAHVCLTGQPLHTGAGSALVHNITNTGPTLDDSIDPDLYELIRSAVGEPSARPTASELEQMISGLANTPPSSFRSAAGSATDRRPIVAGVLAAGLVLATALGAYALVGRASGGDGADGNLIGSASVEAGSDATAATSGGDGAAGDGGSGGDEGEGEGEGGSTGGDPAAGGVVIGDNVEIGPGVIIASGGAAAGVPVDDADKHFVTAPCVDGAVADQVRVLNRHNAAVDYRLTINHFDAAGVRIEESFDTIRALPPGQQAVLGMGPTETGAVGCRVATFDATTTDPALIANIDKATIESCTLDDFLDWYDFVFTVTNPGLAMATAEVGFAVIDADGVRIDDSFTETVYDISAGETARAEMSESFWNIADSGLTVDQCIVTSVEFS